MKFYIVIFTAAACTVLFSSCNTGINSNQNQQDSTTVVDSVNSVKYALVTTDIHFPVELKSAPDNSRRLFIADINGKIAVIKNGKVLPVPFLNISSKLEKKDLAPNVQCLYSLEFNPQFATNRKFYVCYNAPTTIDSNVSKLVVSEFTASAGNPDVADSTSERRIFELEGHTVQNDPCEIAFGPDGYLYIAIGDNGTPMKDRKGEDLNSCLGKLLRVDVRKYPYAIPADNPFIGKTDVKPEIWAYGLRRLWRFSFDTATQTMIGGDVGDKMQEEVDIITKGGNYGWPIVEGDSLRVKNDSAKLSSFIAPIATYGRNTGICVMGGSLYRGKAIPCLQGRYVFADLNGNVFALTKNAAGKWDRKQLTVINKAKDPFIINSCNVDENNEIYLMGTLNTKAGSKGVVYKIVPAY